jgi:hypothetical protein
MRSLALAQSAVGILSGGRANTRPRSLTLRGSVRLFERSQCQKAATMRLFDPTQCQEHHRPLHKLVFPAGKSGDVVTVTTPKRHLAICSIGA